MTPSSSRAPLSSVHTRILLGFIAGAVLGGAANLVFGGAPWLEWSVTNITEPAGKLFLRALLLTVVPLVFSSLVLGVAGLGDLRKLGRVGGKTLAYTLVVSTISVLIGLAAANMIEPGSGVDDETRAELIERYRDRAAVEAEKATKADKPFAQAVVEILPDNPLAAAAKSPPDVLGLMMFAVIFGIALAQISAERRAPVVSVLEGVFAGTSKIIAMVLWTAPVGVACLLFTMTARFGWGLLSTLALYVVTVLVALAFHQFVVYSSLLKLFARTSPIEFFKKIRPVMLTAFSTSSSSATLPTALDNAENVLKVPREISSFVLTIGATANQNGTALFEGVTVLFLAQVFGVDLTLAQQGVVLLLAVVSGIGTAGVPSGSLPFIALVLATIGVPPEGLAIILGVDRFLDMCRTVVNVSGDLACAVIVGKSEGGMLIDDARLAGDERQRAM